MSNALQGKIQEGVLANLLQYLSLNKAVGCLSLKDGKGSVGEVFFSDGTVVHVRTSSPAEGGKSVKRYDIPAMAFLLSWPEGRFYFYDGAKAPKHSLKQPLNMLLMNAAFEADTFGTNPGIDALSDSTVLVAKPAPEQSSFAMTLKAIHLLRHVDGVLTLGNISARTNTPIKDIMSAAEELLKQGLVDIAVAPTVNPEFIQEVTQITVNLMGPMGEIVVEDAMYDLDLSQNALPESAVPKLLREIHKQFSREEWRRTFEQDVRTVCQRYNLKF